MSTELRPPVFEYTHSLRRRWYLTIAVAMAAFAPGLALAGKVPIEWGAEAALFSALPIFWLVGRLLRHKAQRGLEPREVSPVRKISRVFLPPPLPWTNWLFRRELLLQKDAIVLRSRFSTRRILRRDIGSITPLPSEIVIQLVESEVIRVTTCRVPSGFGPLDLTFDRALRAAGFAGLSYNERIAREIERPRVADTAYRTASATS